jgi:hypothetical protein
VTIANASDLLAAMRACPSGGVVELPAGTIPDVVVIGQSFPNITVHGQPGLSVIAGMKQLAGGVTWRNIDFTPNPGAGSTVEAANAVVRGVTGGGMKGCRFHGDIMLSQGLSISSCTGFVVDERNEFYELYDCLALGQSSQCVIDQNDFHDWRRDCIDTVAGTSNRITRNVAYNGHHLGQSGSTDPATGRPGDHSDIVQAWGATIGLLIDANAYIAGWDDPPAGSPWPQGVSKPSDGAMLNQPGALARHVNLTYTNNILLGTTYTGALLTGIDGLTIGGNLVWGPPDAAGLLARLRIDLANITAIRKVVPNVQMVANPGDSEPMDIIIPPPSPEAFAALCRATALRQRTAWPRVT